MLKDCIPYQESLDLKHLGFIEDCIYHYKISQDGTTHSNHPTFEMRKPFGENHNAVAWRASAPLIQQALRWFRDNHNLNGLVSFKANIKKWDFIVYDMALDGRAYVNFYAEYYRKHPGRKFDTYEEAQQQAIREMIEIVAKTKLP